MKKLLLSAIMAIACLTANAQSESGTFSFKPELGMCMGMYSKLDYARPRYAGLIGFEAMYQFADRFAVSAGLRYSQKGGNQKQESNKINYKADYLSLPVLANVYVVKGLAVKAGVELGYNVRSKIRTSLSGNTWEEQKYVNELNRAKDSNGDIDVKDLTKKFTVGIPVGVSYEISALVIDARYTFGMTKAFKDADPVQNAFTLTLGFRFAND